MKFFITSKPPFNFNLVGNLYSRFPVQCVDLYNKGVYKRALIVKDKICLIRLKSVGSVNKPKLSLEVLPNAVKRKFVEERVRWMIGIDDDIKEFYKVCSRDKRFTQIIKTLYGLRAPKTSTVFEALIIAITEQQIALPVAISMRQRLVEKYGKSIIIDKQRYYAFPAPELLAKAKPKDIRELKFSFKKSSYIVDISKKVVSGEINLEEMKEWGKERILDRLTEIKGIGPWTTEYMMCRGMGRYDALPANDMGLRVALTKHLGKKERIFEKEVRIFLERFGKYKGYAAFYLIYNYAFQQYPQEKLI